MEISQSILENLYSKFLKFIEFEDGVISETFRKSNYFNESESFKLQIYEKARSYLESSKWKETDIGTKKIYDSVHKSFDAIKEIKGSDKKGVDLVNWRKVDAFKKIINKQEFERVFFDFYKGKDSDENVFNKLNIEYKLDYQTISYLFFIKEKNKFLPISQEKIDKLFKDQLNVLDFKSAKNISWKNYLRYLLIIKEVSEFLKKKDPETTLLDAHSFLWIAGTKMKDVSLIGNVNTNLEKGKNGLLLINPEDPSFYYPDEDTTQNKVLLFEGATKLVTVNIYERNIEARNQCISHWKPICAVCKFDFELEFGEIGKGFIHVHHKIPISQINEIQEIDPKNDLIPVCPNCHAMLHKRTPPFSVEELKLIRSKSDERNI